MNDPADKLDELLHDWADSRQATPQRLAGLQRRIVAAIEEPPQTGGPAAPRSVLRQPATRSKQSTAIVMALSVVVLCVLLALSLLQGFHVRTNPDVPQTAAIPSYVALPEGFLREKAALLHETAVVFDRRLGWLAESNSEHVDLGIVDHRPAENSRPIAVRLVVERRRADQAAWSRHRVFDVVAYSEEVVRLQSADGADAELTLWSYALPDGMLAIDTELTLAGAAVSLSENRVQANGTALELFTTRSGDYEFRVFQAASTL